MIAGKWPPGAVGAAHAWCHSHYQKPGIQRAKAGHWRIEKVGICRLVCSAIGSQAWAQDAITWRRRGFADQRWTPIDSGEFRRMRRSEIILRL